MHIGWDQFKPSYVQEVKSVGVIVLEPQANVLHVCMIDADNATITEAVWYHFQLILVSSSQHQYIVLVAVGVTQASQTIKVKEQRALQSRT